MGIRVFKTKQNEWREVMYHIIDLLRPDVYVEIGIWQGYTFNRIAPLVKLAVAVEINDCADKLIKLPQVQFIHGASPAVVEDWIAQGSKPIDFLFIDAHHKKETVLADFDAWTPFVFEGTGIIALHDTCFPVPRKTAKRPYASDAAWEIRTSKKYRDNFEIMSFPGPWSGISFVRKAKQQLPAKWGQAYTHYNRDVPVEIDLKPRKIYAANDCI